MSLFFFSPQHKRFTGPCIRFFFLIGDCADNTAIGCGCGDQCSNELMIPSMAYLCVKEKEKKMVQNLLSDILDLIWDLRKAQLTI